MLHNGKLKEKLIHPFTPDEVELIEQSRTPNTSEMNQQSVIAQIYSAKLIGRAAHQLLESNEMLVSKIISAAKKIDESNDRNAQAMTQLTAALVFVGIVQVVVQVAQLFFK